MEYRVWHTAFCKQRNDHYREAKIMKILSVLSLVKEQKRKERKKIIYLFCLKKYSESYSWIQKKKKHHVLSFLRLNSSLFKVYLKMRVQSWYHMGNFDEFSSISFFFFFCYGGGGSLYFLTDQLLFHLSLNFIWYIPKEACKNSSHAALFANPN